MATKNLGRVVGKSTYEIWLEQGNTGTEQEFLESLKGEDGINGADGKNLLICDEEVYTGQGLTFNVKNGNIKITGTTGFAGNTPLVKIKIKRELIGNYVISQENVNGNNTTITYNIQDSEGNDLFEKISLNANRVNAITDVNTEYYYLCFYSFLTGKEINYEGNFQVEKGTEKTTFTPSVLHDADLLDGYKSEQLQKNPLWRKTLYSDGDSIAKGAGSNYYSYCNFIADANEMTLTNLSAGGATIAKKEDTTFTNIILDRVLAMTGEYDYILLEGGTNDYADGVPLGEITSTYDDTTQFNLYTTLGALEMICYFLVHNYFESKKLFILAHKNITKISLQRHYWSAMKEVLSKWGIPYVDLSEQTNLCAWDNDMGLQYFKEAGGIHPNREAYETFYVPVIENLLKNPGDGQNNQLKQSSANLLFGKTIYSDGDSVAVGAGSKNISYAHLLAEKYNMKLTSRANSDTTIAMRANAPEGKESIYERVMDMKKYGESFDYIILDGGANDIFKQVKLGTITKEVNTEFDTYTTLGALEGICQYLNMNYFSAKKLFVFVHTFTDSRERQKFVFKKMKEVLEKWGIPYVDIGEVSNLSNWNSKTGSEWESSVAKDYFASDMLHPNLLGYQEFYFPYVENALLYGGYINSPTTIDDSGEGTFAVSTVIEGTPVKSASYDYQRIGNWVNANITIEFNAFTPPDAYKSISFAQLPYKCTNSVSVRELCVTTAKKKMIWVVGSGSQVLTLLFFDTTSFTAGEKLSFNIRYKVG